MAAAAQGGTANPLAEVRSVRAWSGGETTRIAVELSRETKWKYGRLSKPERLFIDLAETRPRLGPQRVHIIAIGDALVDRARVAQKDPRTTRLVLDLKTDIEYELSQLANPDRLVIEIRAKGSARTAAAAPRAQPPRASEAAPAPPAARASGQTPTGGAARAAADPVTAGGANVAEAAGTRDSTRRAEPERAPAGRAADKGAERAETKAAAEGAKTREPAPAAEKADKGAERAETKAAAEGAKTREPAPAAEKADKGAERAETKAAAEGARTREPAPAAEKSVPLGQAAAKAPVSVAGGAAGAGERPKAAADAPAPQPARPTRQGTRSLTRALGLRIGRVVLDPGHGGHDQGTKGPTGLLEKDLVLDVAKRLGALIEERLGGEVVYTRQTDEFVPLEERTAIANEEKADLFLSIHANSSPLRRVSGAEVYYLNFTTSKEALDLAARENAGHGKSIFELRELIQKIALKDKLEESREFAGFVQRELSREWKRLNTGSRDRGVKKAPFVVLIGASMPSVLAEIGFLSNPRDEELLKNGDYRGRLAEALYRGVERYAESLGQTQALRAATPAAAVQSMR